MGTALQPDFKRIVLKNRMKTALLTTILMLALAAQSIDTITVQPPREYLDFDRAKLEIPLQKKKNIAIR